VQRRFSHVPGSEKRKWKIENQGGGKQSDKDKARLELEQPRQIPTALPAKTPAGYKQNIVRSGAL